MKHLTSIAIIAILLFAVPNAEARNNEKNRAEVLAKSRGFYKDIFMDGGISLTSRQTLPASNFLNVSMEFFASSSNDELTQTDTLLQSNIFCGSENDTNGWLLYPDGAPRFRMIYVNGGKAKKHAQSLGDEGRRRIQEFVKNGGSYLGTCAGAYIASKGSVSHKDNTAKIAKSYWKVWPGFVQSTQLLKSYTPLILEKRSPLLQYFDFGKDRKVEKVRHNGGCIAVEDNQTTFPDGSEVLARYQFNNTDKVHINKKAAIWAYKNNAQNGRVVLCGSHPEGVSEGERLELMSAMLLYAMEGNPAPQIKGILKEGEIREMNKRTEDKNPVYTRIGDRQYHHFQIEIPNGCKKATIHLDGYEDFKKFDLSLCAKYGDFAYLDSSLLKAEDKGCKKSLTIECPKSGTWFVSVFCNSSVRSITGVYGTTYIGDTSVLNGVPYKVWVEFE